MLLAVGFLWMPFIGFRKFPSIPSLLNAFIIEGLFLKLYLDPGSFKLTIVNLLPESKDLLGTFSARKAS